MPVLAAFIKYLIEEQPPVSLLENVCEFPVAILLHAVGYLYFIFEFPETNPGDAGYHLLKRRRKYVSLVHRTKVRVRRDMVAVYGLVRVHTSQPTACLPQHALVADDAELQADLLRVAALRGLPLTVGLAPQHLLNARETASEAHYQQLYFERFGRFPNTDLTYIAHLGENSWSRCTWSVSSRQIPTFRTNGGFYWHSATSSWLTHRERLAIMGFPMYEPLAAAMHTRRIELDTTQMASAVGNCMHLGVVYMVLLCTLASLELVEPT
jgi:hypothetical protein